MNRPGQEGMTMDSGSYRASDADRNQVVDVLQAAYVGGRITLTEHTERTEAALRARTFADLAALTGDLVPVPVPVPPSAPAPAPAPHLVRTEGASAASDQLSTVMSTVKRNGPWRVRRHSVANNLMGSIHLDLTQATFDASVVEVNGTTMLGTLFLRVPAGTTIRDETTKVLGSTSIKDVGEPDPSMPTVVISGTNVLGDVKVRGPKKPSRWH